MNIPLIIAEAGVNHNGSLEIALRMVECAAKAGADYIKFQTFKAEELVTASCHTADYQKKNCDSDSQMEMLKKLELSDEDFIAVKEKCINCGIGFLSTPFDLQSISFLKSLKPDFIKIPSGEITNLPYLREIAETHIPVIISTGMATLDDVSAAINPFLGKGYKSNDIILLHCTTQYPTPFNDVNLRAMQTLHDRFSLPVGYSDHTKGIEVAIAATAMGAKVIEKHFTISRDMEGPDHKASLEPEELAFMVSSIRNVAAALGSDRKFVSAAEAGNIPAARKSIVASKFIKKGDCFSEENLTCKRPGTGLSPMLWDSVIGKTATRDFMKDEFITID